MDTNDIEKKTKGYSIASLVLGIVSVALFWVWYFTIPCSILAIVFGVKVRKIDFGNKFAKAGLILGIISASISVALILCIIILVLILNISIGTLLLNSASKDDINKANERTRIERNIDDYDVNNSFSFDLDNL